MTSRSEYVDHYEEDDHRLMVSGSVSLLHDSETGEWIWDLEQPEKSRIVEVDVDGNVHFEMVVLSSIEESGSSYRAEKLVIDM